MEITFNCREDENNKTICMTS